MIRTLRPLTLLALVATLAACGSSSDSADGDTTAPTTVATTTAPETTVPDTTVAATTPPSTSPATTVPSTEVSASEVEELEDPTSSPLVLISAGDQTETVLLRTLPPVGESWSGTQIVDSQISIDGIGAPPSEQLPVSAIHQTVVVQAVDDLGNITVAATIDDVSVIDPGSLEAEALAAYEASITSMVGIVTTTTTDSAGRTIDSDVTVPDGVDPEIASTFEGTASAFASAQFPQPLEPVGVGAEWTSSTEVESAGLTFTIDYRYRLTAIDGDVVTIEVGYTQTPSPSVVLQGIEFETSGSVDGTGTTQSRIGGLLPIESSLAASGTITMSAAGVDVALNMALQTSMTQDPAA